MGTLAANGRSRTGSSEQAGSRRVIKPLIPVNAEPIHSPVPLRRFRFDALADIAKRPVGRILRPERLTSTVARLMRAMGYQPGFPI